MSRLNKEVLNAEQVVTTPGRPVSKIISTTEPDSLDRRATITRLRKLSKTVTLNDASLKEMILDGRKR